MHRHRPSTSGHAPAAALPAELDKAHGFLWWCDQSALVFGADRRIPTSGRMTLSLARDRQFTTVLPATTQNKPAFFHLDPALIRMHRAQDVRESWLCPRYEIIRNHHLKEAGIVDQSARVSVVDWLRRQYGEPS